MRSGHGERLEGMKPPRGALEEHNRSCALKVLIWGLPSKSGKRGSWPPSRFGWPQNSSSLLFLCLFMRSWCAFICHLYSVLCRGFGLLILSLPVPVLPMKALQAVPGWDQQHFSLIYVFCFPQTTPQDSWLVLLHHWPPGLCTPVFDSRALISCLQRGDWVPFLSWTWKKCFDLLFLYP